MNIPIDSKHIYLDWNVFNRIEKQVDLTYKQIENLILNSRIITPYSNAHINDLIRGYEKNSNYIKHHLSTLKRLTNDLCITQYWGEKNMRWHYRDVFEFFDSALVDLETSPKSFKDLFKSFEEDMPELKMLWEMQLSRLVFEKMPEGFKDLYKQNPVFGLMFPRTRLEMNALSFCEDLYDFAINSKKDYSIYKSLRQYVNQSRAKLKHQQSLFKKIDKTMNDTPSHLNFDESWELYSVKSKVSDNPIYNKITSVYQKIDFKGIKSDEKFSNLVDDSLHVFYGAHCDVFVTLDDKCLYKANKTYEELNINVKALTPDEFIKAYSF